MTKRIVGAATVLAIIVLSVAGLVLWQLRENTVAAAHSEIATLDLVLTEQTEHTFQSVDLVVADLVDELQSKGADNAVAYRRANDNPPTLQLLREKLVGLPQLSALSLVTAEGDIFNSTHPHVTPSEINVGDRGYFIALRDHPEIDRFISVPVRNRSDGAWTVYLARRVSAPDGSFVGVVLGALDLRYFEDFFRSVSPATGSGVALWHSDGTLFARYPVVEGAVGRVLNVSEEFRDLAARGGSKEFWTIGKITPVTMAVAERKTRNFPLIVAVSRTEDAILAPWHYQAIVVVTGVGILLVTLALTAWLLIRQLSAYALIAEARLRADRESEARQELQRSEARFRDIAEVSGDWIWESDAQHRMTNVLGDVVFHQQIHGISSLGAVGKTRWELASADPETDELWRAHKAQLDAHQAFRNFRFSITAPTGRQLHFRVSGKPVFDEAGQFTGYRGTASNETELVEALRRAERADALLRDAVESMSEGFVIYDAEDRYVMCNEAYRRLYPKAVAAMVPGTRFEDILRASVAAGQHLGVAGREEEWIAERIQDRCRFETMETPLADGRWVLVSDRRMANGGIAGLRIDITALKKVQQSLRESQERLDRAQRVANTGSVERDLRANRYEWSDEIYRIFGVSRESFTPSDQGFLDMVHPEDRQRVAETLANGRKNSTGSMRYRIIRPDGSERTLYGESELILGEDQRPARVVAVVKDVTDAAKAEKRQAELEVLLRDAIDSISEGFAIFDHEDRLVMCNAAYKDLYPESAPFIVPGATFEEILRGGLANRQYSDAIGHEEEWLAERMRGHRQLDRGPVEQPLRDGRWALISEQRTSSGGRAGLRIDITALKKVQQSLRESQERLDRAQRVANIGSIERDLRTDSVVWSDETYRIMGLDRDSFKPTSETLIKMIHPDDRQIVLERFAHVSEEPAGGHLHYRIIRPDGEIRMIYAEADITLDDDGQLARIVSVIKDVTEAQAAARRQADLEAQLRHSDKLTALGTLAGGIAHDLNNTLVPIQALSKLLLREFPAGSTARGDLETIIQASLQARDLVRQILAFSRKQELVKRPVDLARETREALLMLRASLPKTIELIDRIEPVPPVLADAGQLHQVIVNLVNNSAHAIGDRAGQITVRVTAEPSGTGEAAFTLRLSVSDTGCGIAEDMIHRIFEPFYTTKPVGEGTGLGLSVAHGIVTGHGGTIEVRSKPGEGAEFVIILPVFDARASGRVEEYTAA